MEPKKPGTQEKTKVQKGGAKQMKPWENSPGLKTASGEP